MNEQINIKKAILRKGRTTSLTSLLLLCMLFCFEGLRAQNVAVSARLDTNVLKIGQQTQLHLSVRYDKSQGKTNITWPAIADTITGDIHVVAQSKTQTLLPDSNKPNQVEEQRNYIITSFDSGYYAIPPFKFVINKDTNNIKETQAMLLQVQTVPVDTTKAIKDIKAPMGAPFSISELVPYMEWAIVILVILAIIAYIIYRFRKREPEEKPVIVKPSEPPHVTAFRELDALRGQKLWQEGHVKQYYIELSEIIRNYIDGRFHIDAPEMTTEEILHGLRNTPMGQESRAQLKLLLILSDLVKFAKEQPLPSENEMHISNAIAFVKATMEKEEINPQLKEDNQAQKDKKEEK